MFPGGGDFFSTIIVGLGYREAVASSAPLSALIPGGGDFFSITSVGLVSSGLSRSCRSTNLVFIFYSASRSNIWCRFLVSFCSGSDCAVYGASAGLKSEEEGGVR
ncbi:unnamed protein product [Eruca vesicaria subsp. sativa]|uniref:Uncharacterized protein n=1 Tax=Eruca vesicaria subsp. sativa TaxID=29727 RepID=A0ABC8M8D7_ERUVS|nr:unnamed protein product [Eruca vesicaria subsp. sativa]